MILEWQAMSLAAVVAVAILAAVVTRMLRPGSFERLPLEHVAAAAIIGVTGWESAIQLPPSIAQFAMIGAGLGGQFFSAEQIAVAAGVGLTVAAFAATFGILRRRPWGVVLGIGVAVAAVATAILGTISMVAMLGTTGGLEDQLMWFVASVGLRGVPAIVALVLLAWPLLRGEGSGLWSGPSMTRREHEGIIDLDPDAGMDDWPDAAVEVAPSLHG